MVRVYILSSKGFVEGEQYIINKPDDINEFPHWNEKFMNVLDGKICNVTRVLNAMDCDETECVVDVDFPEENGGYKRASCTLAPSWVSKIECELEEINLDIKELF